MSVQTIWTTPMPAKKVAMINSGLPNMLQEKLRKLIRRTKY